ncbi:vascular endothelial growth factor receptor 1 isoform X2 [Prorops nasuta]|uniref:vascular endothelial growth factor receptor 1 isoform X2 n=1 Tax=Prorops nasuta TaxID=863751 RepID=UPI0034CF0AFF
MRSLRGSCVYLVILTLCAGARAAKLEDEKSSDEILKFEGEPLEIKCSGFKPIKFVYPVGDEDAVMTSPEEILNEEGNGVYHSILRRNQTVHGDTGWYGCAEEDVEINPNIHNNPNVSWLYVYVRSNTSFFVQPDGFVSLREFAGGTAIIPCRPTWPNLKVTLMSDEIEVELDERITFDPRVGFTIRNVTLRDSAYMRCVITQNDETYEVSYPLTVLRKPSLVDPKIIDEPLRHVTRGQTLYVNCTVEVEADLHYVLNWTTPQQSERISTRFYSYPYGGNSRRAICELIIQNVQEEDQGWYECTISTYTAKSKKTKTHITVYDPKFKYINLTSQDSDKYNQRKNGDRVQWVVYVDAYPAASLRWFNPKGEEIMGSWAEAERAKHAVNIQPSSTILRINRLDVDDMGIYTLIATNEEFMESLNFTLDVMAKPIPLLGRIESYYEPNKTIEINCEVIGFPTPNVTWSFLQCPEYPSLNNSKNIQLTNVNENILATSVKSVVRMKAEMSGKITCTTCNTEGCDSVTDNIFISDGVGGFGILEPKGFVTEGDDLQIICAASIYNYTNDVEWRNPEDKLLNDTERLVVKHETTPFTHRSILNIKNVDKSDSGYYVCSGQIKDGTMERMEYHLQVQDPAAPTLRTNMNGSLISINLGTEGHKAMTFECDASGMPEPNIIWYKDDMMLKTSDQFSLLYKNQTLQIKYWLERDAGKYLCRAENRLGKAEAFQQIAIKVKELPKWIIAFIAILVIIVIALIIFFTIKVRREKKMRKELMEAGLMHFEEGALECLNPDLTVDDQAELLPYDRKWEFPRERLKLGKQLGSGAFGVVMKAEARGIVEEDTVTTVAVKMVRETTEPTFVKALASELKIMVHLGKHLNVVNLLGACTKNISRRELLVIVEYCRFGNLHHYLLTNRISFINQIDANTGKFDPSIGLDLLTRTVSVGSNNSLSANSDSTSGQQSAQPTSLDSQGTVSMSPDGAITSNNSVQPGWRSNYRGDYKGQNLKPICSQDLLSWAFQVARGMEYLSQRRVLHGDLAARNILLSENNVVKICDFGLAKTMYKDDNYKKKGDAPLPIKWMAIESIRDKVFSTQSDIWSFGIVLWEFFTLAETPYPGLTAEKQYQKLIEGHRMEQPQYATNEVYNIMLQCWKAKPALRPSFTQLVDNIGDLLEENVRSHYISLNDPYMDMNTTIFENGKSDYLTMMSPPMDHTLSPGHEYVNAPMTSPPYSPDSSYLCMSPSRKRDDESGIFSPRPEEKSHFEFPSAMSDSEDAIELSPMLKKTEEEDPYLKPINVHERRVEFARQREALKKQSKDAKRDRDSGYCNTPRNLHLIDLEDPSKKIDDSESKPKLSKDFAPTIIRTQDNYVNMPQQKCDLRKDFTDGYSNPSYVLMSDKIDQNDTKSY